MRKMIVPITITVLILGALLTLTILSQRAPLNASDTIGNTAGNLNNKGLFCEQNNLVYFANPYDNDVLYSMNPDETNAKRLTNVAVQSINADSNKIYYSQKHTTSGSGLGYIRKPTGLYSCNLKGKGTTCYTQDAVGIVSLCGSHLYFQHYTNQTGTYLDKIRIDKKEHTEILNQMVTPACVSGGFIYFNGMDKDHYLYTLDTTTDTITVLWEHNLYNPVYQDGYVYFMDMESNYQLHRYELSTGTEEVLSTDRLDYFNLYGNVIYYQKSSTTEPALKRISIDGTNDEIVMEGVFEQVNITSSYAYFNEFDKPTPVYHQSTFGSIQVSVFNPISE